MLVAYYQALGESLLHMESPGSCSVRPWWENVVVSKEVDVCENFEAKENVVYNPEREDIPKADEVLFWGEFLRGSGQD